MLETFGIVSALLLSLILAIAVSTTYADIQEANTRFGYLNNTDVPPTRHSPPRPPPSLCRRAAQRWSFCARGLGTRLSAPFAPQVSRILDEARAWRSCQSHRSRSSITIVCMSGAVLLVLVMCASHRLTFVSRSARPEPCTAWARSYVNLVFARSCSPSS